MKKAGSKAPAFFLYFDLLSFNRTGGANVLASTAIDANVGVYNVFIGTLRNSLNGASTSASAAAYALVRNRVCHKFPPIFMLVPVLYHKFFQV